MKKKNNKIMFTKRFLEGLEAFHIYGKLRVLVSNDEVDIEVFDFMGSESDCIAFAVGKGLKHNVDIYINGKPADLEEELEKRSKVVAQNGNEGTHYISSQNGNCLVKGLAETNAEDKVVARKKTPIYSGFVKYFPNAMAEVSRASLIANEQHHEGQPLHWDMDKSTDELDALMRHLTDHASGEEIDDDGIRHLTKVAWRSMAMLERTLTNKVTNKVIYSIIK